MQPLASRRNPLKHSLMRTRERPAGANLVFFTNLILDRPASIGKSPEQSDQKLPVGLPTELTDGWGVINHLRTKIGINFGIVTIQTAS